jgi:hypothetical protein
MSAFATTFEGISGLFAPVRSTAQSDSAKILDKLQKEVREHILNSYVMSSQADKVISELDEVRAEASREGWDGYGARPLDHGAYVFGKMFLNALPSTAPLPEVSADTDGEVALDWIFGERKALTVSIGRTGRCTYAWMLGQRTNRGTDWIDDEIPAQIVIALGQLVRATTAQQAR